MTELYKIGGTYCVPANSICRISHPRILESNRLSGMPTKYVYLKYCDGYFRDYFTNFIIAPPKYQGYPAKPEILHSPALEDGLYIRPSKRHPFSEIKLALEDEYEEKINADFPQSNKQQIASDYISTFQTFKDCATKNLEARKGRIIPFNKTENKDDSDFPKNYSCPVLTPFDGSHTPKHL